MWFWGMNGCGHRCECTCAGALYDSRCECGCGREYACDGVFMGVSMSVGMGMVVTVSVSVWV